MKKGRIFKPPARGDGLCERKVLLKKQELAIFFREHSDGAWNFKSWPPLLRDLDHSLSQLLQSSTQQYRRSKKEKGASMKMLRRLLFSSVAILVLVLTSNAAAQAQTRLRIELER